MLEVDDQGFDLMDRKLLLAVIERFNGKVGVDDIAAFKPSLGKKKVL